MPTPRPDKQRDLLDGALRVFARDGYTRASIEAIAAEAGVSTRTIYNHFGDKASLFRAVIIDSAQRTARHEIEIVRRHLSRIVDPEEDLVAFGLAWASSDPETALHFDLVRQVRADIAHIPHETIDAWQQVGPLAVRAEIATHIRRLARDGVLRIAPGKSAQLLAAHQLVALTAGVADRPGQPHPRRERERIVRSGVRVFLKGYATGYPEPSGRP
jgi:AcrR family transcriptional regulator